MSLLLTEDEMPALPQTYQAAKRAVCRAFNAGNLDDRVNALTKLDIEAVSYARAVAAAQLEKVLRQVEPVASIYVSPSGDREFDDWKVVLPTGRNELFTHPDPDQAARIAELEQQVEAKYVRDHCEPMSPTEIYAEGRGDQFKDDCAIVSQLLAECDDVDATSSSFINTTRVRELLAHFVQEHP